MRKKEMRKKYDTPRVLQEIGLQLGMTILTGSVAEDVCIEGQEIGGYYDSTFSENPFNHEWGD